MNTKSETNDLFRTAHSVLLIGYSIFVVMHCTITFLLGWEKWILIPILAGLIAAWGLHLSQTFTDNQRLWLTAGFMMCTYFIYGTHQTSTYDLSVVMAAIIMLFIMTRVKGVITLCQITFYITISYDLIMIAKDGYEFGILDACRIVMNYCVITMIAGFIKTTINKWNQVTEASKEEIHVLTESASRLNDFLANVSHELRTPINAVIGLSGICLDKETNPEIRKDLKSIRKAGHRVAEQISDILDFSELDNDKLVKNCEDYTITSLINDLILDFREMKKDNIELIVNMDPQVPAVMNSDPAKLKKIIKALVSNSLKFTSEGGVYLKIYSEKQPYGVNLLIEVSDTGCGMSEDELERIFDRFYQSDSSRTRKTGGLGLGLSLVHGFVSLLGGFMVINSTEGKGTTVSVSIPQTVVSDAACMSITNARKLSICTCMDLNRFKNPFVREYFSEAFKTLVQGLSVELYRAENLEALKKIDSELEITHLFVTQDIYMGGVDIIEKLAAKMVVAVMCNPGFTLPKGSKARLVEKPLHGLSLVNILNSEVSDNENLGQLKLTGVHALVVDDEHMNLVVAKSIFKRYDIEVSTAPSGPVAIDMCRDHVYTLIFMDHMMSGMDGVEAMKKIRADVRGLNHETPVIALTANAMSSAKQMFISEGFDGFVSKPIEFEELERVLKKVLPKDVIRYETDEVQPADTKPAEKDDDIMEFSSADDGVLEFPADDEVMEFSADDEVLEFGPDDEVLEFGSAGGDSKNGPGYSPDEITKKLTANGINAEGGLFFCAGDTDLYFKICFGFALEMEERVGKLNGFYDSKDWKNYEVLIHSTKSTAKMVGAQTLSDHALALENAASAHDEDYITKNHASVMAECTEIGEKILSSADSPELAEKLADREEDD